ncbi:hypothetical protein BKP35_17480 [Anaerobacillus arseniciselenatis]|uniref:Uncharacterized protein n=1 Tax=Anaerobacillus arseniciselenatis TaxID=85682 RepID=A0A1S2L8J9_9BACI|nr:hypothetical protein BKP35_17480 [Anaerobacillus arseniciselenatis]
MLVLYKKKADDFVNEPQIRKKVTAKRRKSFAFFPVRWGRCFGMLVLYKKRLVGDFAKTLNLGDNISYLIYGMPIGIIELLKLHKYHKGVF